MLTVKLMKGRTIKIIEATEVHVFPCGRSEDSDNKPEMRTDKVREIAITRYDGKNEVFYISDYPVNDCVAHCGINVEHFDCAYVENAHGATTERINAR